MFTRPTPVDVLAKIYGWACSHSPGVDCIDGSGDVTFNQTESPALLKMRLGRKRHREVKEPHESQDIGEAEHHGDLLLGWYGMNVK